MLYFINETDKNRDRCLDYARQVNPHLKIFQVSATTGVGLDAWVQLVKECSSISSNLTF